MVGGGEEEVVRVISAFEEKGVEKYFQIPLLYEMWVLELDFKQAMVEKALEILGEVMKRNY